MDKIIINIVDFKNSVIWSSEDEVESTPRWEVFTLSDELVWKNFFFVHKVRNQNSI